MPKDTVAPGHNSKAREADLLALMAEMRPGLDAVEAAKALVKKAEQSYAVIRNKAEVLGFTLKTLDKALKAERQPTARREQQAQADEEFFIFKTLGLPVAAAQGQLDFGSDEERDEAYWGDQGYQAGIRGDIAKPPDPCPPHLHKAWLDRRAAGAEYSAWGKAEAGGKPDQGKGTTIDEARAAKGQKDAEKGAQDGDAKAGEKDPLLT